MGRRLLWEGLFRLGFLVGDHAEEAQLLRFPDIDDVFTELMAGPVLVREGDTL